MCDQPLVYIVLLNWNSYSDTINCYNSLKNLKYKNYKVLIIDNGSTDNSESILRQELGNTSVEIIQTGSNLGYAGGNNVGIKRALHENSNFIWLLNNDTEVHQNALKEMVDKIESKKSYGICGSKLVYFYDRDILQAHGGGTLNKYFGTTSHVGQDEVTDIEVDEDEIERKLDYIVGASMLIKSDIFKEFGFLEESYFLYYEELDIAMRIRSKYQIAYASKSIIFHKEGGSLGSSSRKTVNKSEVAEYYGFRSRLLFMKRFFPNRSFYVYLGALLTIIKRLIKFQFNRAKMILNIIVQSN